MGQSQAHVLIPREKPIIPALLSMAGSSLPLFFLIIFTSALLSPQPFPFGGEGPDPLLILQLATFVAVLAILPIIFSTLMMLNPAQHRVWGGVLVVWWGLASAIVLVGLVNGASTATQSLPPWYTAVFFTPFLGLLGGVWGFFWHTGVNPRVWTLPTILRRMRGLSGRVAVGGLACFVFSVFASPVLTILPFFLIVGNLWFAGSGLRSRARGLVLMGLVVGDGLVLSMFEFVEYLNASWEVVPRIAGLAGFVAMFLAGSGLAWSIRGRPALRNDLSTEQLS